MYCKFYSELILLACVTRNTQYDAPLFLQVRRVMAEVMPWEWSPGLSATIRSRRLAMPEQPPDHTRHTMLA